MSCFVKSVTQISSQKPLTDEWFYSPRTVTGEYVEAQEPDFRPFISGSESRRMGKLLKRAIATALTALSDSGTTLPDAIVMGTGKGCLEHTEKILQDMCFVGEESIKPTLFMLSTHNTISSQIAIKLGCRGYNNTYSHKGISFESALLDAWIRLRTGSIGTALVGAHDEMTNLMSQMVRCNNPEYVTVSETSVASVLSSSPENALCEVKEVTILHRPDVEELAAIVKAYCGDVIVAGINGNPLSDSKYIELFEEIEDDMAIVKFKDIFGENFSSSAIGFYVGVKLLEAGTIPEFLFWGNGRVKTPVKAVTVINHTEGTDWSIIKLETA